MKQDVARRLALVALVLARGAGRRARPGRRPPPPRAQPDAPRSRSSTWTGSPARACSARATPPRSRRWRTRSRPRAPRSRPSSRSWTPPSRPSRTSWRSRARCSARRRRTEAPGDRRRRRASARPSWRTGRQELQRHARAGAGSRPQALNNEFQQKIKPHIDAVAKEKGIDIILTSQVALTVNREFDISRDVIVKADDAEKAARRAAGAAAEAAPAPAPRRRRSPAARRSRSRADAGARRRRRRPRRRRRARARRAPMPASEDCRA